MATMIKCGDVITADFVKSGTKADGGSWEFIKVNDKGKGKRDITVWVSNAPSCVQQGGTFSVEKIESVKWGARKDSNEQWHDEVSINAIVKPFSVPSISPAGEPVNIFTDMDDDEDALPF